MDEEESTNARFVQIVGKWPLLYDNTLPNHASKKEIDKVWQEVAKEANLNEDACKDRWRNLRNSFTRHLRQNPVAKNKKPYYLAKYMDYLIPFTRLRGPKWFPGSPPVTENSSFLDSRQESANDFNPSIKKIEEKEENVLSPARVTARGTAIKRTDSNSIDIDEEFATSSSPQPPQPEPKRRYVEEHPSENPDLLFFKSLLPDMAALTPAQRSAFKLHILQKLNDLLYCSADSFEYNLNLSNLDNSSGQFAESTSAESFPASENTPLKFEH